jgi:hypothetical protein
LEIDFEGWFSILFDSCFNVSFGFPNTVACLMLFEVVKNIVQKRKLHVRIYSYFSGNWSPLSSWSIRVTRVVFSSCSAFM